MKIMNTTSKLAIIALLATAGATFAGTTGVNSGSTSYDAAVSVLSPDQTGFIIGGQVAVTGLGSGSAVLSRSAADMSVTGNAFSGLDTFTLPLACPPVCGGPGPTPTPSVAGAKSGSDITSALNFSRDISTAGSLVGQGSVVARGEAIASMGTAGAANASGSVAGTNGAGAEGSASAMSTSQGSLNGSLSTANTLQLLGTSGLFAGSNALDVGETNKAIAYGSAGITADGYTGVVLNTADADLDSATAAPSATGDGALFVVNSTLTNQGGINLSVSNAGNGTISLTTSTGGFFTGGGAAGGSANFVDNGGFFSQVQ